MADGRILRQASACQDELLITQILDKTPSDDIAECCSALDADSAARLLDQLVYKYLVGEKMDLVLLWIRELVLLMRENSEAMEKAKEPIQALVKYAESRRVTYSRCLENRAKLERLETALQRSAEINAVVAALGARAE